LSPCVSFAATNIAAGKVNKEKALQNVPRFFSFAHGL
jgi:hypothetical protein